MQARARTRHVAVEALQDAVEAAWTDNIVDVIVKFWWKPRRKLSGKIQGAPTRGVDRRARRPRRRPIRVRTRRRGARSRGPAAKDGLDIFQVELKGRITVCSCRGAQAHHHEERKAQGEAAEKAPSSHDVEAQWQHGPRAEGVPALESAVFVSGGGGGQEHERIKVDSLLSLALREGSNRFHCGQKVDTSIAAQRAASSTDPSGTANFSV